MKNISETHNKFRVCQPAAMPLIFAREERLGVIVILGVIWGLYLGLLFNQFNQTEESGSLWAQTNTRLVVVLGIGLLGILLSRKLIAYAQQIVLSAAELANHGVLVTAQIVDRWQHNMDVKHSEFIAYRFEYQDSIWIGEQLATQQPYSDLQIGDDVVVRFLPRNPRVCELMPSPRQTSRKPHKLKIAAPYRTAKMRERISFI